MDAINKTDLDVTAVSYGRKDKLIAGEPDYKELFVAHQQELEELGKRPDLLLFRQDGASRNFDGKDAAELIPEARKAVAAFEVRSSKQSLDAGRDPGRLSFTPKVEDIRNVVKWIGVHEVPHYYVQVLFGKVYAISFEHILELLAHSPESGKFRILRVPRNQFKSTIFIPLTAGTFLSTQFQQPQSKRHPERLYPPGS